jgi:hypothetical protein
MKWNCVPQGCAVFLSLLAVPARAGTVTVEKIVADEVLTREIGPRPPAGGEELYYDFAADAGAVAADASGNGRDGTVSGCVWTDGGPYAGGAMFFDGVDDYIAADGCPDFPAWERYTVSLWFLHNGGGDFNPGYGHKMVDKTSWYHDWTLILYPFGGTVGLSIYEGGASTAIADYVTDYMDSSWHHLAVIRDGPDGRLWVDGALKSTCTNMFSVYSTSDVCVGYSFSGDYYQRKSWSGLLDEVRVYGRALPSNEVAQLYAEGFLTLTNTPAPVVSVTADLTVAGGLTVTGNVSFAGGVLYSLPLGDLSCGVYTNAP